MLQTNTLLQANHLGRTVASKAKSRIWFIADSFTFILQANLLGAAAWVVLSDPPIDFAQAQTLTAQTLTADNFAHLLAADTLQS